MKSSLEHLPELKQEEIQSIVETIVSALKPEMIILFGSYSRGNWVEDRYKENGTTYEYKSDYDILVVTEKYLDKPPRFGTQLRHKIKNAENLQTTPHIIFHDIEFLNKELEVGHYFFADIIKEGTMLYDTGKYELAKPKELTGIERTDKAKIYFKEWLESANRFFKSYELIFNAGLYNEAIFLLHQSTERYFVTIQLVFTDYKPKTHDLDILNREAGYADARLKVVFPNQTEEEKRLFTLLQRAYIDSRYKEGYTVDAEDLKWLAARVGKLRELVERVCGERIEGFGNQ